MEMVSCWLVASVVYRARCEFLICLHACHEYAVKRLFARRHFLRRVLLMSLHVFRLVHLFIPSVLTALISWCVATSRRAMAATSVDPRIYSSAPFAFKADRGIFSGVPTHQIDGRIFSPIDLNRRHACPNVVQDHVRLRHDL